jgi:hypothetical protein
MIDVFLRRSDALRNLRELKLLRMMRSSEDIVGIRHVMLPSTPHTYNTIFFVMEHMDNDLRQVGANVTVGKGAHRRKCVSVKL